MPRSSTPRGSWRSLAGLAALVAPAALLMPALACTDGDDAPDPHDERSASVYVAIVDWFAAERSDDPEPLPVFVEPRGDGASIPLEAQTALITATADVADVRFIDERAEALTDDDGRLVAADGGVLLRLPPVDQMAEPVVADVDVHLEGERFVTLRFELGRSDDGWSLLATPEQIATPVDSEPPADDA